MRVYLCGLGVGMTEEFLDIPQVGVVLQEMRRKGVPEGVHGNVLLYPGLRAGPPEYVLDAPFSVSSAGYPLEEVTLRAIYAIVLT